MDAIIYIPSEENKESLKEYLAHRGLDCIVVVWNENEDLCKNCMEITGKPEETLPCLFHLNENINKYEGIEKIEGFLKTLDNNPKPQ